MIKTIVMVGIAVVLVSACTRVSYRETRPDGTEVAAGYIYFLQDKTNEASLGDFKLKTSNSNDPAAEALGALERIAAGGVKK